MSDMDAKSVCRLSWRRATTSGSQLNACLQHQTLVSELRRFGVCVSFRAEIWSLHAPVAARSAGILSMEVSLAVDPLIVQNIHQQLLARNAVEVRAFSGITSDYQQCLRQLRDLRVRQNVVCNCKGLSSSLFHVKAFFPITCCRTGAERTA